MRNFFMASTLEKLISLEIKIRPQIRDKIIFPFSQEKKNIYLPRNGTTFKDLLRYFSFMLDLWKRQILVALPKNFSSVGVPQIHPIELKAIQYVLCSWHLERTRGCPLMRTKIERHDTQVYRNERH